MFISGPAKFVGPGFKLTLLRLVGAPMKAWNSNSLFVKIIGGEIAPRLPFSSIVWDVNRNDLREILEPFTLWNSGCTTANTKPYINHGETEKKEILSLHLRLVRLLSHCLRRSKKMKG